MPVNSGTLFLYGMFSVFILRSKLVDKEILMQYNINCIVNNAVCASGSVVERLLAKEKVAGSIPVSRFFYTGNKKLKLPDML